MKIVTVYRNFLECRMLRKMFRFFRSSKGATAIEYALIASLIAVVAISGMKLIGNAILNQMTNIAENLAGATGDSTTNS